LVHDDPKGNVGCVRSVGVLDAFVDLGYPGHFFVIKTTVVCPEDKVESVVVFARQGIVELLGIELGSLVVELITPGHRLHTLAIDFNDLFRYSFCATFAEHGTGFKFPPSFVSGVLLPAPALLSNTMAGGPVASL